MKRVFPLIVVLITLSVLGIVFIQVSWISNSLQLKQQQKAQDYEHAETQIKQKLNRIFLNRSGYIGYIDDETQKLLLHNFTVQIIPQEEVEAVVDEAMNRYNIKEPYEYAVTNIFQMPIMKSERYDRREDGITKDILLTPPDAAMYYETLHLYIQEDKNFFHNKLGLYIAGSILFTLIIISAFYLTLRTMFNQKKLSEIKSDFINNMTHELKTPLATISLAIDALVNEKVIHDTEKIRYYSGMIKDENKRMNKQVEKILQSARIEKQDIKLNLQVLNAHEIIKKVADNVLLQVLDKGGKIEVHTDAQQYYIKADEVHFSNVVFNLLDNAIKYSKENLLIEIFTKNTGNMFMMKIRDNGIGMNRETQARVFEKFYRAHTGNIHDVKGFGLGLSYVKAIVDAHGGKVKLDSNLGKGSTFSILFPITEPENQL